MLMVKYTAEQTLTSNNPPQKLQVILFLRQSPRQPHEFANLHKNKKTSTIC